MKAYKFSTIDYTITVKGVIEISFDNNHRFETHNWSEIPVPSIFKKATISKLRKTKIVGKVGCKEIHIYKKKLFIISNRSIFTYLNKKQLLETFKQKDNNTYYEMIELFRGLK